MCICDVRVKNSLLFKEINSKCLVGIGGVTGMAAAQRMWVCVDKRVGPVWGARILNGLLLDFMGHTLSRGASLLLVHVCAYACKKKHVCPKRGLKIVWPEFRTMCYLLQIYSDMIGLVVIITWEHLVLFSLNHCSGKPELFQRTVGAILLLDSISVSLWLLDNSIFGKAGGKMCDVNSP